MPLTQVLVTGTVPILSGFSPSSIMFVLSRPVRNGGSTVTQQAPPSTQVVPTSSSAGVFSVSLAANDDAGTDPSDSYYTVLVSDGGRPVNSIDVVVQAALAPTTTLSSLPIRLDLGTSGATRLDSSSLGVTRTVLHSYPTDLFFLDATASAFTVLLPSATKFLGQLTLRSVGSGSNLTTVTTSRAQTIDGGSTTTLGPIGSSATWASLQLVSDGKNWWSV